MSFEENGGASEVVVLDLGDPPERSERDLIIGELNRLVNERAREIAREAKTLADYFRAFRLSWLYGSYDSLSWMDELPEASELFEGLDDDSTIRRVEKAARVAEEMRAVLDRAPDKEGYVKLTVRQIRDEVTPRYRVLAEFPGNVVVPHTGFDALAAGFNTGKQVVYYEPHNACYRNAADDARKASLEGVGVEYRVYYLKLVDLEVASSSLVRGKDGVAHYITEVDDEGRKVKQNVDHYLLPALLGSALQESYRIRVSDYWKRER